MKVETIKDLRLVKDILKEMPEGTKDDLYPIPNPSWGRVAGFESLFKFWMEMRIMKYWQMRWLERYGLLGVRFKSCYQRIEARLHRRRMIRRQGGKH